MASSLLPSPSSMLPRSLANFLSLALASYIPPSLEPSALQTPVYHQVTDELQDYLDCHGKYWWRASALMLAALLHDAGYSTSSQYRILTFFGRTILPYMGPTFNPRAPQWHSFMTDDHHPIELSWDWHTGHTPPTVRFSIEPVGLYAGTPLDKDNEHADAAFRKALLRALLDTSMEWFYYLDRELTPTNPQHQGQGPREGHPSKIFYAFDLAAESITAKAYFFPGFKARETNRTNLQVIADVITRAPHCSPEQLNALRVFEDFADDINTSPLEMDMLAIDMDPPERSSRLKIYFRNRTTSFASVRQIMTLGQRVTHPGMGRGLSSLRRLWDAILGQGDVPDGEPLAAAKETNDHRTAGLLYNVELRSRSSEPKVKLYIPVRHYALSDNRVISAVHEYMKSVRGNENGLDYGYADTMQRFL
ncbi:aromatic prenyltransferase [Aspergillus granulosus]|uniref:Aromatic prenyltransferase n=1 Tax=Aspergillus granulosus TaxID=176169 RepID=A0ABR4HDK3_9EURO